MRFDDLKAKALRFALGGQGMMVKAPLISVVIILPSDPAYQLPQEALAWHRNERFGAFVRM
jgi:hypothetical protein